MAEDLPAEQILRQLIERLDLLDRVMGANTARLHEIEKYLGSGYQQQRLADLLSAENREQHAPAGETPVPIEQTRVPTGQVDGLMAQADATVDKNPNSAPLNGRTTPPTGPPQTQPQSNPVSTPGHEPWEQTWPQSQPAEQTWRSAEPPQTAQPRHASSSRPADHSWMNQGSIPHTGIPHDEDATTYATRAADAPFSLANSRQQTADSQTHGRDTDEDAQASSTAREAKRRDLEATIGGSWFNWIGIIAITLGVGFFLKYAFDKQWIGPVGRVIIAAFLGFVLLYLGDRLRGRGMKSYAYILSGGGLLILYLSDFAAYNFYHLINQPTAFLLMAAVTTTAVLLSVRLNALPIALLGLVGGFLTPLLLSTGVDNAVGLFTYIALLDAGVLAVAYFKRWRSLDFASFAGTVAITVGWAFKFYTPGKVWIALFFLSVFFVLYALLAIFHNVLHDRPARWFDVALTLANAAFYFGFSYLLLSGAGLNQATPATQALLVSIFFAGLFYTTWRWSPDDVLLRYSYVGAAATFLTIAVAMQLELHWVTMAWAIEALVLTWVGLRSSETAARHAGIVIFCVAVGHWFMWDMLAVDYTLDASFLPILNRRALSCFVLVGAIVAAARLYKRPIWEGIDDDERSTVRTFFALVGNGVALTLLSLDLNDYFAVRASISGDDVYERIQNTRHFSISMLWTLYAATILAVGVLRRSIFLRAGGLLLLSAAISKVVVFDSAYYAASWHFPIVNQTFMAYALLVAALGFAAWIYRRTLGIDESEQHTMVPLLTGSANVLALAALSLEVVGYYDRAIAGLAVETSGTHIFGQFEEGKIFTLALVWTIYALAAFFIGVRFHARAWRLGALLLLVFTIPLVLANLTYYDASWHRLIFNRTLAGFAITVVALWFIVRTYARSGKDFVEAATVRVIAMIAGNLLAITALSGQAAGYYEAQIALRGSETIEIWSRLPVRGDLELAKQLSLSVVWALYASGLLIAGQIRHLRLLRVMGLGLLSLTVLKAFVWDLSSLDRIYRIISFIMLGAILLVVSYFYQRSQNPETVRDEG